VTCGSLKEALALELGDPGLGAVLGHVVLVVLVEHAAAELAVDDGLGLHVVVAVRGGEAHDVASGSLELVVELSRRVAVVVSVALLVADSKHCNILSGNVEAGELVVEPLIPGGSGALGVSTGVPGGGTDDDIVETCHVTVRDVNNVLSLNASAL